MCGNLIEWNGANDDDDADDGDDDDGDDDDAHDPILPWNVPLIDSFTCFAVYLSIDKLI